MNPCIGSTHRAIGWLWWLCYLDALRHADRNTPVLFSSRIDGALLPFDGDEVC